MEELQAQRWRRRAGSSVHSFFVDWGTLIFIILFLMAVLVSVVGKGVVFRTYPGILIATAAGFLGAVFSMLVNSQRISSASLEELALLSSWHAFIVRGFVGLGGAILLYFFFESGLLEGDLWPDVTRLETVITASSSNITTLDKDWCLLIIWSFLAGFSENLVPTLLQKTEAKAFGNAHSESLISKGSRSRKAGTNGIPNDRLDY